MTKIKESTTDEIAFSQLVRKTRKARGLTLAQLAREVGYDASYFSLLERGLRHLDDEAVVRVALCLGLDPGKALLAALRERLPPSLRGYLSSPPPGRNAEAVYDTARAFQAEDFDFEIGRAVHHVTSDLDGNITLRRRFEDCRPNLVNRPVPALRFRERATGGAEHAAAVPTKFDVLDAPPKLRYETESSRSGMYLHHRVLFPEGWRRRAHRKGDAFSFAWTSHHPKALSLDLGSFLRRAADDGLETPVKGSLNTYVRYFVRRLEVTLEFPRGYEPEQWKPCVWFGSGPLESGVRDLGDKPCRRLEFDAEGNRAELSVAEPLAGYTFSITWIPLDTHEYLEARIGGRDDVD